MLQTNDPAKLGLALFKKGGDGTPVVVGKIGEAEADITALKSSQFVADGAYKAAFTDGTSFGPKVDANGFTVLAAQAGGQADTAKTDESTTGGKD